MFAPTDEAFAKLPKGTVDTLLRPENKQKLVDVLTYHVVKGKVGSDQVVKLNGATTLNGQQADIRVSDGKVMVDKATVVKSDIGCSNGVIHVIDSVILPATDNLAETAEKAGSFKTLLAAAQAAGLVEPLTGKDALTVFAPTDEAFGKLPEGTVESLLKPEKQIETSWDFEVPRRFRACLLRRRSQSGQGDDIARSTRENRREGWYRTRERREVGDDRPRCKQRCDSRDRFRVTAAIQRAGCTATASDD